MSDQVQIKDLDSAVVTDNDYVIFQLATPPYTVYKTTKSALKGDTGDPATADAGTTVTLAPGSLAKVTNVGTIYNAIFNFEIPEGEKGETGDIGPIGMDWQGAYNALVAYSINDGVSYLGSSYICIQAATGESPDVPGSLYWNLIAQKGNDGIGTGDVIGPATNTADYIPQWDGADSKTLKDGLSKTTWLQLVGVSGGQKAIGGTGITDVLTLQGTSGNGTAIETAILALVGNNGGTTAFNIRNNGRIGIGGSGAPSQALDLLGNNIQMGAGRIMFGGYTDRYLYDAYGFSLVGNTTRPIQVRSTSLLVGINAAGADYGTGNIFAFGTLDLGNNTDTTISRLSAGVLGVEGVAIPTISSVNTLTNKRITSRVTSESSSATPTINTDNSDAHSITALAADITSMTTNLSGTPTNFQKLIVRIKDNGTARAIAWGASFEAKGVALPTTTVISKVLTVGFIYDTVTSKWGCVASAQEA